MTSEVASGSDERHFARMPGLDVVRGIAIFMVLVFHGIASHAAVFVSYNTAAMLRLNAIFRGGAMGVHLFFILSGFLITGILMDGREKSDYYRKFYLRRALRIVPAYLLMLLVLKLTHSITWRYIAVCVLYLCNMPGLLGAKPQYGPLWSLSVEEQFYLTWPFIVRKLSRRYLLILSLIVITLTPIVRLALLYAPATVGDIHFKTWDVCDFLTAGAALAIAFRSTRFRPMLQKSVWPLIMSGGALLAFLSFVPQPANGVLPKIEMAAAAEPWLLLLSGVLVFFLLRPASAQSFPGKLLVFLADISYGLYLCHQLLFELVDRHWPDSFCARWGEFPQLLIRFGVEVAISIAIAWLSRRSIEQYFLRFKPRHVRPARA